MRLDPVFVIAPIPSVPSMPTRRAFLFAGSTFAVGVTLGGACGYAVGVGSAPAADPAGGGVQGGDPAQAGNEELPKSGDAELDELRRLAVKAPIEELVENRLVFVNATFMDYPLDRLLWQGVERLADYLIKGGTVEGRAQFAKALAGVIEQADPVITARLRSRVPELRRLK